MKFLYIYIYIAAALLCPTLAAARNTIFDPQVKTLQVVAGDDWLSPAVIELGGEEVINVSFDQLSHTFQRYTYHIDHCEDNWQRSEEIFESDFLEGFKDNTIDEWQNSRGTTVDYTHYSFTIPNERCRLKLSGNYRITVYNEDADNSKVLEAEFRVVEPLMRLGMEATSNTDIDVNRSHQQVSVALDYGDLRVTNVEEQVRLVVTQNGRSDNPCINPKPNLVNARGLRWQHNRSLIFDAGNEYRKFEVLDVSHPTMGIERIDWDGQAYNVYPFVSEPRPNYLYDEDADGSFYIRNSDNIENDITTDYVFVHYILKAPELTDKDIIVDGHWATDHDQSTYRMTYDPTEQAYFVTLMQKQGYYSYHFLARAADGSHTFAPSEGSYYQTENRYQAYAYYRTPSDRTWRLVAYRQLIFQ